MGTPHKILRIKNELAWLLGKKLTWEDLLSRDEKLLYAGHIGRFKELREYVGLSNLRSDSLHIFHDVSKPMPIPSNIIDRYQSEDVFEHINSDKIIPIFNDIYRVLKPGGLFRLSLPDYRFDQYKERSFYNHLGEIVFDPKGGGFYSNNKILGGGHLWFPKFEIVKELINNSIFELKKANFLHYYNEKGESITKNIDYNLGPISRTPDFDKRGQEPYRAISIVVDLYK